MKFQLREYQKEAIDSAIKARNQGYRRLLICLPTGAGKTVIFSKLCEMANSKVLVLAHREELLSQAKEKIERMTNKKAVVCIEQGENTSAEEANIVVASIRSLRQERLERLKKQHDFRLVIYDECHHSAAEDNMRVLRQLGCFDGDWNGTLIGFTATPSRADGIGLGEVFELIVYERNIVDMIRDNYLVPLRGFRINTAVDLYNILHGTSQEQEELAEFVDVESRNALIARSIQELARDRRTIVFCVSVNHALNLAKSLNALGIPTGAVYGNMPREKRKETLRLFRQQQLLALTNVGVLTEGFDDPGVSCIAMARPTKSEALYAQCLGRGARLAPNKKDCIVLDFVDLSGLSLVNLPSLLGLPKELDLQGATVSEAIDLYRQLKFDYPGFELEAGEITLGEIKMRAEGFDPLNTDRLKEYKAISPNGWFSLGNKGLCLHFFRQDGELSKVDILKMTTRGKKYHVFIDDKEVAKFSKITDAIEAVDYELEQMGPIEAQTANDKAEWRFGSVPGTIQQALAELKPPRTAKNIGDALGYLSFAKHHTKN